MTTRITALLLAAGCVASTTSTTGTPPSSTAPPTGPWIAMEVETVADGLPGADGIAWGPDGALIVSDPGGNALHAVDVAAGTHRPWATALAEPYGLAALDGAVLAANWGARNVLRVTGSDAPEIYAEGTDRFGNVFVDAPTGDVYLPSFTTGLLERITPSGDRLTVSNGVKGAGLHAVVFDDDRVMYTGYVYSGEIHRHDADGVGTLHATLPGNLGNLAWVDGQLLASSWDTHRIYEIGEDGSTAPWAGQRRSGSRDGAGTQARFTSPNGLLYVPEEDVLYVVESIGRVRRIQLAREE